MMEKQLQETYKDYEIFAIEETNKDENNKINKIIFWFIKKDGIFVITDTRAIDGSKLQSAAHAINDAKKNIDAIYNLKKYK